MEDRLEAWRSRLWNLGAPVLASDFDGTLAPIQSDPAAVTLPDRAKAALEMALAHGAHVAIVSGRSLSDLRARFADLSRLTLIAAHGLQADGEVSWQAPTAEPARWLAPALGGVRLEDKGPAAAVHLRGLTDGRRADVHRVVTQLAAQHGFELRSGKHVLEVLPSGASDKGAALRRYLHALAIPVGAGLVALGDDDGDAPMLAYVRARLRGLAIAAQPASAMALAAAEVALPQDEVATFLLSIFDTGPRI